MSATLADCGCECRSNADPCEPCWPGSFQIQCRTRTDVAALVGHNEFGTPSIPPRKYRVSTLSGYIRAEEHNTPSCSSPVPQVRDCAGSGARTINDAGVSSGAYLGVGTSFPGGTDPTNFSIDPLGGCVLIAGFSAGGQQTVTSTKTARALRLTSAVTTTPPSSCCGCLSDGSNSNLMATSTVNLDLTDEDTESRAEARSTAVWSEWGEGGACCSVREDRGAGDFIFTFTKAEYRVRVAGPAGTPINIEVTFTQTGGLPFTETIQRIANGPNFIDDWQEFEVESERGKSICLSSARILPS